MEYSVWDWLVSASGVVGVVVLAVELATRRIPIRDAAGRLRPAVAAVVAVVSVVLLAAALSAIFD